MQHGDFMGFISWGPVVWPWEPQAPASWNTRHFIHKKLTCKSLHPSKLTNVSWNFFRSIYFQGGHVSFSGFCFWTFFIRQKAPFIVRSLKISVPLRPRLPHLRIHQSPTPVIALRTTSCWNTHEITHLNYPNDFVFTTATCFYCA